MLQDCDNSALRLTRTNPSFHLSWCCRLWTQCSKRCWSSAKRRKSLTCWTSFGACCLRTKFSSLSAKKWCELLGLPPCEKRRHCRSSWTLAVSHLLCCPFGVLTRGNVRADDLSSDMCLQGLRVQCLHGGHEQRDREEAFQDFKDSMWPAWGTSGCRDRHSGNVWLSRRSPLTGRVICRSCAHPGRYRLGLSRAGRPRHHTRLQLRLSTKHWGIRSSRRAHRPSRVSTSLSHYIWTLKQHFVLFTWSWWTSIAVRVFVLLYW